MPQKHNFARDRHAGTTLAQNDTTEQALYHCLQLALEYITCISPWSRRKESAFCNEAIKLGTKIISRDGTSKLRFLPRQWGM